MGEPGIGHRLFSRTEMGDGVGDEVEFQNTIAAMTRLRPEARNGCASALFAGLV